MSVAIVTDSTACVPVELAAKYEIEIVPLHLIFGGRTFTDSLTSDTSEFYDVLRTSHDRPTTAAPSPGMFLEAIGRALHRADTVLCITVSKQFSAMYDSARQAIELARTESPQADIRLLDSRGAAMAQGFVVLEAARTAAGGAEIDAVEARAVEMTTQTSLLAMLDTLTYLARGGRVPRVAAWAAGMLQVKPLVRFTASDIKLVGRTRTRRRALNQMIDVFAKDVQTRPAHIAIHHANAPDDATFVRDGVCERANVVESHVTEFTQVMGAHTGPGLVGIAWWAE